MLDLDNSLIIFFSFKFLVKFIGVIVVGIFILIVRL